MNKLFVCALLCAGAAEAELDLRWRPPETHENVLLGAAITLIWIDVGTTLRFRAQGETESNILLGGNPSPAEVVLIGGVAATAATALLWYTLPPPLRTGFAVGVIGVEGYAVSWNLTVP